jgi:hypothetical protein
VLCQVVLSFVALQRSDTGAGIGYRVPRLAIAYTLDGVFTWSFAEWKVGIVQNTCSVGVAY